MSPLKTGIESDNATLPNKMSPLKTGIERQPQHDVAVAAQLLTK